MGLYVSTFALTDLLEEGPGLLEQGTQLRAEWDELSEWGSLLEAQVDGDKREIRNVVLVGSKSANRRTYPPATLRAAVPLYEGARINVDHPGPGRERAARSMRDLLGRARNVRFDEAAGKIRADVRVFAGPDGDRLLEIARSDPNAVGFSHNALGRERADPAKRGHTIVEAIAAVRSVDVVTEPATTKGIFEGARQITEGPIKDKVNDEERSARFRRIHSVAMDMIRDVMFDHRKNPEEKPTPLSVRSKRIRAILADWLKTLNSKQPGPETPAMEGIEKLTAAQLGAARPDLVEYFREEGKADVREKELKESEEKRVKLEKERDEARAEITEAQGRAAIEKKLAGMADLPEAAQKRIRSSLEALLSSGKEITEELVEEAVKDTREFLTACGVKLTEGKKQAPKKKEAKQGSAEFLEGGGGGIPADDQTDTAANAELAECADLFGQIGGLEQGTYLETEKKKAS